MSVLPTTVVLALIAGVPTGDDGAAMLRGTSDEQGALGYLNEGKFIKARELADKARADGRSFIGDYVLGQVLRKAEGQLPRALFLIHRSRTWLADEFGDRPKDPHAVVWHKRLLTEEADLLGEMDSREEQLALLKAYDEIYTPKIEVNQIWPLMKLRRYDEARALGRRLTKSTSSSTRRRAYNGLSAIEEELRNRKANYEATMLTWQMSSGGCVTATNVALACRFDFRFTAARRYLRMALNADRVRCNAIAYIQVARVSMIGGRFDAALSALKEALTLKMDPQLRIQKQDEMNSQFVALLYALGQLDDAEERGRRLVMAPDRLGSDSRSKEAVSLSALVLYLAVLRGRIAQQEERVAVRPWMKQVKLRLALAKLRLKRFETGRRMMPYLLQQDLFVTLMRPYWLDAMPWFTGAAVPALGSGVVRKAVRKARALETDRPKIAGAYMDGLLAEAAWHDGSWDTARQLAEQALETVPTVAKSMRWQLRARLAAALMKLGKQDEASKHLAEVMDRMPSAIRHLSMALPVTVKADGDAASQLAAKRLFHSPRFDSGDSGFLVSVSSGSSGLTLCLDAPGEREQACITQGAEGDTDETVALALDAFADKVFAPKVDLSQGDLHSLDGRTGRMDADKAMRGILGEDTK